MLKQFYVHNYRTLQNFTLDLGDKNLVLLIGKNGSGKSNLLNALEILQKLGRGENALKKLFAKDDFAFGDSKSPIELDLQLELDGQLFEYKISVRLREGHRDVSIMEEKLSVDKKEVFVRSGGEVKYLGSGFVVDWHQAALPIIQDTRSRGGSIQALKDWLAHNLLLLSPNPKSFYDVFDAEDLGQLHSRDMERLCAWFWEKLSETPSIYPKLLDYLKAGMLLDLSSIEFAKSGLDGGETKFVFKGDSQKKLEVRFSKLSDGERIFFLWAALLAVDPPPGGYFCFWDEPGNYISLEQLTDFMDSAREWMKGAGQAVFTSHTEEIIRAFPTDNVLRMHRSNHCMPSQISKVTDADMLVEGDLIQSLRLGLK
jgi:predicted ATPase